MGRAHCLTGHNMPQAKGGHPWVIGKILCPLGEEGRGKQRGMDGRWKTYKYINSPRPRDPLSLELPFGNGANTADHLLFQENLKIWSFNMKPAHFSVLATNLSFCLFAHLF